MKVVSIRLIKMVRPVKNKKQNLNIEKMDQSSINPEERGER